MSWQAQHDSRCFVMWQVCDLYGLSSSKDVFERFTFPVGDERWFSVYFSQQIDWFSVVTFVKQQAKRWPLSKLWPSICSTENFIFSVKPIGRIFMPLCLLALWQFYLSLLAHLCCNYWIGRIRQVFFIISLSLFLNTCFTHKFKGCSLLADWKRCVHAGYL